MNMRATTAARQRPWYAKILSVEEVVSEVRQDAQWSVDIRQCETTLVCRSSFGIIKNFKRSEVSQYRQARWIDCSVASDIFKMNQDE